MIYARDESEVFRAKMKAARRIFRGDVGPGDLPSNREVRDQIEVLARMHEGRRREAAVRAMRGEALRMMRILRAFHPRLTGGTLRGQIGEGSGIDLHLFSERLEAVTSSLDAQGIAYAVRRKPGRKQPLEQGYPHVRIEDQFSFELTVYLAAMAEDVLESSITGEPIERASIAELEALLAAEDAELPLEQTVLLEEIVPETRSNLDRFESYRMLLLPLENVKESREYHPEGDALYHSLQVFELARQELPYDEEFLLAALLHDVGKAIDPKEHTAAGLEALEGLITPRTAWLIEHHPEAAALRDGTLGARSRRRLKASENFEELKVLAECDRDGRVPGMAVPEVEEALWYVRDLARTCGE